MSAAHPPVRRGPLPVVLSYPPALERQWAVPGTKEVAHADPPHRRAALSEQQRGCETEQLRVHQTEERAWEPAQTGARTEEQPAKLATLLVPGYLGRAEWRPTDAQPGLTLAGMVTRTVSSLQQVLGDARPEHRGAGARAGQGPWHDAQQPRIILQSGPSATEPATGEAAPLEVRRAAPAARQAGERMTQAPQVGKVGGEQ